MSTVSIRRVSHALILCADNAQQLIDEYAVECSVPDAEPQHRQYAALEATGALQVFGAYVHNGEGPDELVGFASVLSAIMPHNGKRVGTLESIFVLHAHRGSGAGNFLLAAAEHYAGEIDCVSLLETARIGSDLEKVLRRRSECLPTHTVFTRWL